MTGPRAAGLARELRERIALGDVGAAGALESESALSQRYAVSRVTVRAALEELRGQGVLESRRGAGWFVSAGSFHQTLALGTFRHAASAVSAAGKSTDRQVVEFGFRPAPSAAAAALALPAGDEVLHVRSVRSVDGVPLDLVHEWVPASSAAAVSRADAEGPGTWATLHRLGHRIDVVRQFITAAVATDADAVLLGVPAGEPLLVVRRLAHDDAGHPLALSDHRYLAHRFSLEVEFRGWSVASSAEPPGLRSTPPTGTPPTTTAPSSTTAPTTTAPTTTSWETDR